jgi:hypothetical protein
MLLMKALKILFGILSIVLLAANPVNTLAYVIPQTGAVTWMNDAPAAIYPNVNTTLDEFVDKLSDGNGNTIRGIYGDGVFALRVIQQPVNQPAFVSKINDVVTQFMDAKKYGSVGLLAHNFLSGKMFYQLKIGDAIQIIYGDGSIEKFQVETIYQFQALQPENPRSTFIDVSTGTKISATGLFMKVYTGKRHLTLQTCIQKDNVLSWGRYFVLANPISQ